MRKLAFIAIPLMMASAQPALAKGCLRGAAAGAAAGHFVGKGHAMLAPRQAVPRCTTIMPSRHARKRRRPRRRRSTEPLRQFATQIRAADMTARQS